MNAIPTVVFMIVLAGGWSSQTPGQWSLELEKRAVANAQRTPASELDAELPKLSFANWFKQAIGPGTEIIWQISECGKIKGSPTDSTGDIRACTETNTILPDGRKVIVMIAVGTFRKGMTGAPAFHVGVIAHKAELYPIRRLRDLPNLLSSPGSLANRSAVNLPDVKTLAVNLTANGSYLADLLESGVLGSDQSATVDEADESPPPPPEAPKVLPVSWGRAINKAQPRYPPGAKRFNIAGSVDVQITISAAGRVTEAKAISGHPLLRAAAEEAALQWVFEPATMSGVPVETQTVLTFAFKAPKAPQE